jgi:hypothetical protein
VAVPPSRAAILRAPGGVTKCRPPSLTQPGVCHSLAGCGSPIHPRSALIWTPHGRRWGQRCRSLPVLSFGPPPWEALLPGTGWCRRLRHPSHPTSVGLACRLVGAWRRHLVKQINYTGRNGLPDDLAVWDGPVVMIVGNGLRGLLRHVDHVGACRHAAGAGAGVAVASCTSLGVGSCCAASASWGVLKLAAPRRQDGLLCAHHLERKLEAAIGPRANFTGEGRRGGEG